MKMSRTYTFDVPDFDDCGGRTTRRVEVPKAVFRQIEADVAAPLEATIHQLGENAAKAAGEYAEEVGRLRNTLQTIARFDVGLAGYLEDHGDTMEARLTYANQMIEWRKKAARAALTEPTDG